MKYPVMFKYFTLFSWGCDIRLPGRWLTICWKIEKKAYISRNGTPCTATCWLYGKPRG